MGFLVWACYYFNMKETFELPPESVEGFTHTADINGKVYDVYKLIELAKAIKPKIVPTALFDNNKGSKFWITQEGQHIGPSDIINALGESVEDIDWDDLRKKHPEWEEHIESIRNADYERHPIMYTQKDLIVDGMHRLTKAWIDKVEEIKAKWLEELPDSALYKEPSEE